LQEQGIDVIGLNISLPFVGSRSERAVPAARSLGIRLVTHRVGDDYIEMLRRPKHGYGKGFNPCVDCRIYMLKVARELMASEGAAFVVTGDIVRQRPKSQIPEALSIEERKSGLAGLVVRPLSAGLLEPTQPELDGTIDRSRLLSLKGRTRTIQLEMAQRQGLTEFGAPAGGCPLTNREFGSKARTMFEALRKVTVEDLALLRHGRHYYTAGAHVISGRNEKENHTLLKMRGPDDIVLWALGVGSPFTLLRGRRTPDALLTAARLTAAFSDAGSADTIEVEYVGEQTRGLILVEQSTCSHAVC
ncbi:MAG: tRNA 4-thiouridine(8) synthase ThiI, partial [Dehalococcoidia bacterium]|nr:tRNA 4-thiouridine(8) synthase ThiI [Dehalococcoidia bacterium]